MSSAIWLARTAAEAVRLFVLRLRLEADAPRLREVLPERDDGFLVVVRLPELFRAVEAVFFLVDALREPEDFLVPLRPEDAVFFCCAICYLLKNHTLSLNHTMMLTTPTNQQ